MKDSLKKFLTCSVVAVVMIITSIVSVATTYKKKEDGKSPVETVVKIWDGETKIKPTGTGTKKDPYIISCPENLAYLSTEMDFDDFAYYSVTDDLDMGGHHFVSIGNGANTFKGVFDGNGHKIFNLGEDEEDFYSSYRRQAPSLFGMTGKGEITDLTVEYAYSKAVNTIAYGGIVQYSIGNTKILRCANVTEKIEFLNSYAGYQAFGGILGRTRGDVTIEDCYSLTDLTFSGKTRGLGGLLGYCDNDGNFIRNSYTAGKMTALSGSELNVGNIVGFGYDPEPSLTLCVLENTYSIYDTEGSITNTPDKWETLTQNRNWLIDPNLNNGLPFLAVTEDTHVGYTIIIQAETEVEPDVFVEVVEVGEGDLTITDEIADFDGEVYTVELYWEFYGSIQTIQYTTTGSDTEEEILSSDSADDTGSATFEYTSNGEYEELIYQFGNTGSSGEWDDFYYTIVVDCFDEGGGSGDDEYVEYTTYVTFDANGGTINGSESYDYYYVYNETDGMWDESDLRQPDARAGYTFLGWYDTSDEGGNCYSYVDELPTDDSITLYAIWTANEYTLTMNANGGKISDTTNYFTEENVECYMISSLSDEDNELWTHWEGDKLISYDGWGDGGLYFGDFEDWYSEYGTYSFSFTQVMGTAGTITCTHEEDLFALNLPAGTFVISFDLNWDGSTYEFYNLSARPQGDMTGDGAFIPEDFDSRPNLISSPINVMVDVTYFRGAIQNGYLANGNAFVIISGDQPVKMDVISDGRMSKQTILTFPSSGYYYIEYRSTVVWQVIEVEVESDDGYFIETVYYPDNLSIISVKLAWKDGLFGYGENISPVTTSGIVSVEGSLRPELQVGGSCLSSFYSSDPDSGDNVGLQNDFSTNHIFYAGVDDYIELIDMDVADTMCDIMTFTEAGFYRISYDYVCLGEYQFRLDNIQIRKFFSGSPTKTKTVTYEESYGDLPTPVRTGWTFDGWFTQEVGGERVYSTTTYKIAGDSTIYAHWTQNKVTVNPGTFENISKVYYTTTAPSTSYSDNLFTSIVQEGPEGSINGTTITVDDSVESGGFIAISLDGSLSGFYDPDDTSYILSYEWLDGSYFDFSDEYDEAPTMQFVFNVEANQTIYLYYCDSCWDTDGAICSLTFSEAGAYVFELQYHGDWDIWGFTNVSVKKETFSYTNLQEFNSSFEALSGTTYYFKAELATQSGYTTTFNGWSGWFTSSDSETSYTFTEGSGSVTLNASASLVQNSAIIKLGSLSNISKVYYGTSAGAINTELTASGFTAKSNTTYYFKAELPTATGYTYTFAGWSGNFLTGNSITASNSFVANGGTYTISASANKTANSYTINYVLNGGSHGASHPSSYVYSATSQAVTVSNPTKTGSTFNGWSISGSASISATTLTINAGATGTITLTANWTANAGSISYNGLDGATYSGTLPSSYQAPSNLTFTLPTPSKNGYNFTGWTVASGNATISGTTLTVNSSASTGITVTANWTTANVDLIYDLGYRSINASTSNAGFTNYPVATNSTLIAADGGASTNYYVNWDKDFSLSVQFKIMDNSTRKQILGSYSNNVSTDVQTLCLETYVSSAKSTLRLWIGPNQTGNTGHVDTMIGGAIPLNTIITVILTWDADNKKVSLVASGNNYSASLAETSVTVSGKSDRPLRFGTDYRGYAQFGTIDIGPLFVTEGEENTKAYGLSSKYLGTYPETFTPARNGFTFNGWTDKKDIFDFNKPIFKNTVDYVAGTLKYSGTSWNGWYVAELKPLGMVEGRQYTLELDVKLDSTSGSLEWSTSTCFINNNTSGTFANVQPITPEWQRIAATFTYTSDTGTYANDLLHIYPKMTEATCAVMIGNIRLLETNTNINVTSSTVVNTACTHTIKANWTQNYYQTTFSAGNGNIAVNSGVYSGSGVQATKDFVTENPYTTQVAPSSSNITRTGYTFGGWYEATDWKTNGHSTYYTASNTLRLCTDSSGSAVSNYFTAGMTIGLDVTLGASFTRIDINDVILTSSSYEILDGTRVRMIITLTSDYITSNYSFVDIVTSTANSTYTINEFWTTTYSTQVFNTTGMLNASVNGYSDANKCWLKTSSSFVVPKWTANSYTVTFNAEDGVVSPTEKTVSYGLNYGDLPTPTKAGYTFKGWFYNGAQVTTNTIMKVASSHILNASWESNSYTATLNANGGTISSLSGWTNANSNTTSSKTVTYDAKYGPLPTVTKSGYAFNGWYESSNPTNLFDVNDFVDYMQDQYYSAYGYNSDLNYNSSTGILSMVGWHGYHSSTKTTFSYKPDLAPGTYTITYKGYAVGLPSDWSTSNYTTGIHPRYNDGTDMVSSSKLSINTSTEKTYTATFTIPVEGFGGFAIYYWHGYYVNIYDICLVRGTSAGTDYTVPNNVNANSYHKKADNITLYANWVRNEFNVTLDNQGATTPGTTSVKATYGLNLPTINEPEKTGYTFGGYYTQTNGGGTQYYDALGAGKVWNLNSDITLYAKWTANSYTVTYNSNAPSTNVTISDTVATTAHTYDTAKALSSSVYTATGTVNYLYGNYGSYHSYSPTGALVFVGWNTKADGSGTMYQPGESVLNLATGVKDVDDEVTLYAQWKVQLTLSADAHHIVHDSQLIITVGDIATVTLNSAGSAILDLEYSEQSLTITIENSNTAQLYYADMNLSGVWKTGFNNETDLKYTPSGNGTIRVGMYENFIVSSSKATDSESQNGISSVSYDKLWNTTVTNYTYGSNCLQNSGILFNAIVKDGYTFKGWTITETDDTLNPSSTTTTINFDHSNYKTVTKDADLFDLAEGSFAYNSTSKEYIYVYRTWNNWANGLMTDVTAVASATANEYTVTFDANGGTFTGATTKTATVKMDSTITLPSENPTRSAYNFAGWYTASDGGTQVTSSTVMGAGDIRVYARWNQAGYLAFDANGGYSNGNALASRRIAYGEELGTLPAISNRYPYFYRDGYNFLGWFTEKEGGSQVYATTVRTEGMDTLYAHWSPVTFRIIYNGNGADSGSTSPSTHVYDEDSPLTANAFERTGYTFLGWDEYATSASPSYPDKSNADWVYFWEDDRFVAGSDGVLELTVYAIWEINNYNLTVDGNGGQVIDINGRQYVSTEGCSGTLSGTSITGIYDWPYYIGVSYSGSLIDDYGNFQTADEAGEFLAIHRLEEAGYYDYNVSFRLTLTSADDLFIYHANDMYDMYIDEYLSFKVVCPEAGTYQISFTYDETNSAFINLSIIRIGTFEELDEVGDDLFSNIASTDGCEGTLSGTTVSNVYAYYYVFASTNGEIEGAYSELPGYILDFVDVSQSSVEDTFTAYNYTLNIEVINANQTIYIYSTNDMEETYGPDFKLTFAETGKYSINFDYCYEDSAYSNITVKKTHNYIAPPTVLVDATIISVKYDEVYYTKLPTPVREGYTFTGWNTARDGSGTVINADSRMPANDLTIYAQWTANDYDLVFDLNTGDKFSDNTTSKKYSVAFDSAYGTLPVAVKAGYSFTGWNTSADGSGEWVTASTKMTTLGATVYAIYGIDTYTLTVNFGDIKLSSDTQISITATGCTTTTGSITTTSSGATFTTTHSYDASKTYAITFTKQLDGANYRLSIGASSAENTITYNWAPTGNTTISLNIAQLYTIKAFSQTGISKINNSYNSYNQTHAHGDSVTLTATLYGGYEFDGWYNGTSSSKTKISSANPYTFTVNSALTLYAYGKAKVYQITLDKQGGTGGTSTVSATYGQRLPSIEVPTRVGYQFMGYYIYTDNKIGDLCYAPSGEEGTRWYNSSDKTLYALWEKIETTLTLNANGGTFVPVGVIDENYFTVENITSINGSVDTDGSIRSYYEAPFDMLGVEGIKVSDSVADLYDEAELYYIKTYSGTVNVTDGALSLQTSWSLEDDPFTSWCEIAMPNGEYQVTFDLYAWWPSDTDGHYVIKNYNAILLNYATDYYIQDKFSEDIIVSTELTLNGNTLSTSNFEMGSCGGDFYINDVHKGYSYDLYMMNEDNGTLPQITCSDTFSAGDTITLRYEDYEVDARDILVLEIPEDGTYEFIFNILCRNDGGAEEHLVLSNIHLYKIEESDTLVSNIIGYGDEYGTLREPAKEGYTFAGYTTLANGGISVNSSTPMNSTTGATIYAQWTANTYTVKYDINNPTGTTAGGSMADSTFTVNSAGNLRTNAYTASATTIATSTSGTFTFEDRYLTFNGWNTKPDGSGTKYVDGQTIENLTLENNAVITLYAQWKVVYTFTYKTTYSYPNPSNIIIEIGGKTINLAYGGTATLDIPYSSSAIDMVVRSAESNNMVQSGVVMAESETAFITSLNSHTVSITPNGNLDLSFLCLAIYKVSAVKSTGIASASFDWYFNGSNIGNFTSYDYVYSCSGITFKATLETGYSFEGWFTNAEGTGNPVSTSLEYVYSTYNAQGGLSGPITLYAIATPNPYTLTLDANGGEMVVDIQEEDIFAPYNVSDLTISDSGVSFEFDTSAGDYLEWWRVYHDGEIHEYEVAEGWNEFVIYGMNCFSIYSVDTAMDLFRVPLNNDRQYIAKFFIESGEDQTPDGEDYSFVRVSNLNIWLYDDGAGIIPNSLEVDVRYSNTYGSAFGGRIPKAKKAGYDFLGWYTAPTGGTPVSSDTIMGSSDVIIYAQWSINEYTLTFDANGGNCSESSRTLEYNSNYGTLPEATRTGYTFNGWFTARTGGTKVSATTKMGDSNTTIYAQWDINSYSLTFDANGGTVSAIEQVVTELDNILNEDNVEDLYGVDDLTFSSSGLSWSKGTDGYPYEMVGPGVIDGDQEYRESYHSVIEGRNVITITGTNYIEFYNDAGEGTSIVLGNLNPDVEYTLSFDLDIDDEDENYYHFSNVKLSGIGIQENVISASSISVKVNYNAKYVSALKGNTLPVPVRDGYTFLGWNTAQNGSGNMITGNELMGTSPVTVYAQWEINASAIQITGTGYTGVYDASEHNISVSVSQSTGLSVSYQWYKDSTLISGATSSTYAVKNVADSGVYKCKVTVGDVSVDSSNITVSITPANMSNTTISLDSNEFSYNMMPHTPIPTVKFGTITLVRGVDYSVNYTNNTNAGEATLTVTGSGNFTGTNSTTFTIKPRSVAGATFSAISDYTFTGGVCEPKPTVSLDIDGVVATLVAGTDFIYSYTNNINAGTATVKITGKGNFTGTESTTFVIKNATMTITSSGEGSYTYDSTDRKATVQASLAGVTIYFGTTASYGSTGSISAVNGSLVIGSITNVGTVTYYYKAHKDNYEDVTGTITITINPRNLAGVSGSYDSAVVADIADEVFTGSEIKPSPVVTMTYGSSSHTLVSGTDYTVSYSSNVQVGTATVTITGKGNFTGTISKTFNIVQQSADGDVIISGTASYGETLSASVSGGITGLTYNYKWYYSNSASGSWTAISGANSSDLVLSSSVIGVNTVAGLYFKVEVTSADSNYEFSKSKVSSQIGTKAISLSGLQVANKVYDSNTTATITTHAVISGGVLNTDTVTLVNSSVTATFASASVGTKTVTASGYTISGINAGNYTLNGTTTTTADITTLYITVTAKTGYTPIAKEFDGTNVVKSTIDSTYYSVSSTLASVKVQSAVYDSVNVGNRTIAVKFSLTDTTNMAFTTGGDSITLNGNINQKSVEVVWNGTSTFTYNAQDQSASVTATYVDVAGLTQSMTVVFSGTATTFKNVGTYTATASHTNSNYKFTNTTKTYTISQKEVTISWINLSPYTYTGSAQGPTANVSGIVSGDSASVNISGNSATNVGSYTATATLTGASAGNYILSNDSTNWTIEAQKVAKPSVSGSLTYTGSAQSPTIATNSLYTISDNVQTNAGSYTAKVKLNDKTNYTWSDGSTADLSLGWSISKATSSLSLNNTSINTQVGKTESIKATITYVGTITNTSLTMSGHTGYADISSTALSGKESTISIKATNPTTKAVNVTVSWEGDNNHTGCSAEFVLSIANITITLTDNSNAGDKGEVTDENGNYSSASDNQFTIEHGDTVKVIAKAENGYAIYSHKVGDGELVFADKIQTEITVDLGKVTENTEVVVNFEPTINLNFKVMLGNEANNDGFKGNYLTGTKLDSVEKPHTIDGNKVTVFGLDDLNVDINADTNEGYAISSIKFGLTELLNNNIKSIDSAPEGSFALTDGKDSRLPKLSDLGKINAGDEYDVVYTLISVLKVQAKDTLASYSVIANAVDEVHELVDNDNMNRYIKTNASVLLTVANIPTGYSFLGFNVKDGDKAGVYYHDSQEYIIKNDVSSIGGNYAYNATYDSAVSNLDILVIQNYSGTISSNGVTGTLTHVDTTLTYNVTVDGVSQTDSRAGLLMGKYTFTTMTANVTIVLTHSNGSKTYATYSNGVYSFEITSDVTNVEIKVAN